MMDESRNKTIDIELPKGYRRYKLKGLDKEIIAKKGGPTARQIKTKASYKELRNNQKEFGVASMMAKTLRQSLSRGMSEICETYVSGKLTAQFRNLAKMEEGKTGTRPLFLSKHGHLLKGFEFNTKAPYEEVFGAKYFVKPGSQRGQVILHFPAFIPEKTFKSPKGATNFKITARLIALSDYQFDQQEEGYVPLNKELHGKFGTYESSMLPLLKIPTEPMTGMVSVDNRIIPQGAGLFLVMAISFYKLDNGKFEHLSKESGMQIQKVL
ncbi:MAG: hypothetical protein HRT61_08115 [Ekhidna sp.]|nr:hypothetical protein [Ekhidna sp.]